MRKFALVLLLVLILAVPCGPVNSGVASEWAQGTAPFTLADDGDTSSDSITSFSETTDDDVMFYPDTFRNDTPVVAYGGNVTAINEDYEEETNDYTDTQTSNDVRRYYTVTKNSEGTVTAIQQLNFDVSQYYTIDIIEWNIEGYGEDTGSGSAETHDIEMWNFTSTEWDDVDDFYFATSEDTWHNDTITAYHYNNDTTVMIRIKSTLYTAADPVVLQNSIDYAAVIIHHMTLAGSKHFGEGFSDVSDWSPRDHEADDSFSSDGDVMTFECNWAGGSDADSIYTDTPSGFYAYWEVYFRLNTTTGVSLVLQTLSDDGGSSGGLKWWDLTESTSWASVKLNHYSDTTPVESCRFYITTTSANVALYVDYVRAGPADEMGWQHDGSTVEGVTAGGGGSVSSDGSELSMISDSDGSYFDLDIDTTATQARLSTTYYPFFEIDFNDADSGDYVKVESYDGAAYATLISNTTIGTAPLRANIKAADSEVESFRVYVNPSATARMTYAQAYGIANWTVSQHASTPTTDYYYVDNGALNRVVSAAWWIELNHDPALSINTDTYPVCNITVSNLVSTGGSHDYGFLEYVGASRWIYDTSRFALTSGTMTDCRILTESGITISSIKFIEDGTAPDADIVATPTNPYDDESVTLSSIVFDTVEVYKVWFKAITYPAGFSDQDYEATEGQENYWSYTFAAGDLIVGDYCFKVIANDGANNSTISLANRDYATVRFTVREATLRVDNWRIDVGSAEVSGGGYCNKDASVAIYEDPEKDGTYVLRSSTSVSTGTFAFYWTRYDDTEAGDVRYAVKFTNSSETWWENGTYARALSESFVVESWDIDLHLGQQNYVEFDVLTSFENATIYAYDNDTLMATATESAGGVSSYFWMDTGSGIHVITLNITHGATTYTKTKSYYVPDWADGGLVVRFDIWTFQNNYTLLTLESNWMNCTFYVYLNDSLVATSYNDPVTLNITRTLNVGTFNLTIFADGGTQTYTISNIRYIVTEDGVSYDYSSVSSSGGVITYEGDEYEGDTFEGDTYEGVSGTDMATVVLELIVFMTLVVIVVAGVTYRDRRNRDDEIYKAQIAAGGYA